MIIQGKKHASEQKREEEKALLFPHPTYGIPPTCPEGTADNMAGRYDPR